MTDFILQNVTKKMVNMQEEGKWSSLKTYSVALLSLIVLISSIYLPDPINVIVASFAGVGIFVGGYIIWFAGLPLTYSDALDIKGKYNVFERRKISLVIACVWFIFAIFAKFIPQTVLGGLSVAIILTLIHLCVASAEEKEIVETIENDIYDETLEKILEEKKVSRWKEFFLPKPSKDESWDDETEER